MIKKGTIIIAIIMLITVLILISTGCKKEQTKQIKADGSSTVFPITEAVAEEFQNQNPNVRVTVGLSGTGGGFEKFTSGEIDIANASRQIKDEESALAKKNNIEYIEFKVAFDGLSVLVNPANDFVKELTVAELKKIWEPNSKVKTWKDIRPNWPDRKIGLYGPGTDSGTFDYFTKEIVGEEDASRPDYTASEDDNTLVQGISGDKNALGYFGFAYYQENKDKLKLVAVDGGKGAILPSDETIKKGTYTPLSRPLFIYVNKKSLARKEVEEFIKFYIENAETLSKDVGYTPFTTIDYENELKKLSK